MVKRQELSHNQQHGIPIGKPYLGIQQLFPQEDEAVIDMTRQYTSSNSLLQHFLHPAKLSIALLSHDPTSR